MMLSGLGEDEDSTEELGLTMLDSFHHPWFQDWLLMRSPPPKERSRVTEHFGFPAGHGP